MAFRLPRWSKLLLALLGVLLGLYVFFQWLAPPLLPFLVAPLLARLMEPAVRALHERARLPRPLSSLIVTVFGIALLLGVFFCAASWAMGEANKLIERLPYYMTKLPELSGSWYEQANAVISAAPVSLQELLRNGLDSLWSESAAIPAAVYTLLVSWVSAAAGAIPSVALFIFATLLSTYLISRDYPNLTRRVLGLFSAKLRAKILFTKDQAFITLGKWFRAQVYLMGLTFLILLAGFLILRVEVALLPAVVIALLDALPVIGAGFCLIPWAIFSFLGGSSGMGFGLLAVYGAVVLTRVLVEPRLVGRQIGLDPLLTFAAMYVGLKTVGVAGLILFPVLAMVLYRVISALIPAENTAARQKIKL